MKTNDRQEKNIVARDLRKWFRCTCTIHGNMLSNRNETRRRRKGPQKYVIVRAGVTKIVHEISYDEQNFSSGSNEIVGNQAEAIKDQSKC